MSPSATTTLSMTANPQPAIPTAKALGGTQLFTPLKLGAITLKHRVIMAPLTRNRSPEHIPTDLVTEYYSQRASDGGLLISEATHISVQGGNYIGAPGVFTPEHRRAWSKVTAAVHKKGGYVFCQLWHIGRVAHPLNIGRAPLGPSANSWEEGISMMTPEGNVPSVTATAMTDQDIADTIEDYVHAARTAIAAGFDGVEIHGANGYIIDQFLSDNVNVRTDKYGGSVENRARLAKEVVESVAEAIGADRVGIRFSPFGMLQGTAPSDTLGQFTFTMKQIDHLGLAYVHLVEPRVDLFISQDEKTSKLKEVAAKNGVTNLDEVLTLKPFRRVLKQTPLLTAGGFVPETANEPLEGGIADAVVWGRWFISNPDLPERLRKGLELQPYNRDTFFTHDGVEGYTDYPTYEGKKNGGK